MKMEQYQCKITSMDQNREVRNKLRSGMVVYTINTSSQTSVNLKLAWSTYQVPGQPGLRRKILSQKRKRKPT